MSKTEVSVGLGGCAMILLIWAILIIPAAWCWDYTVSHWLVFMGKPDKFNMWWHGYAMALIPGLNFLVLADAFLTFLFFNVWM